MISFVIHDSKAIKAILRHKRMKVPLKLKEILYKWSK